METPLLFVAHGIDADFLRACDHSLDTVLTVCRFITPTFMSIALIISIGRGYLSGNGLQMDFSPVIKAVVLFLLLFLYRDLMDVLGAGIKGVTHLFDGTGNVGESLQRLTTPPGIAAAAQADQVAPADVVEEGGSWYARIYNSLANFSIMHLITQFFTGTTVMLVRQIVLFIRQFVLGFLYVIGPIAICLSVIPAFSGLSGKWLQNFIAVQFWALTMNLLDLIYTNFAAQDTVVGGVFGSFTDPGQPMDDIKFLLMSVSFIILYCMVPTLTGYFIGSTAVQSFMSTTISMAAGAAAAASSVAFPGAYGGGASGALGRALGFGGGSGSGGSGESSFGTYPSAAVGTGGGSSESVPSMGTSEAAAPVRNMDSKPVFSPPRIKREEGSGTAFGEGGQVTVADPDLSGSSTERSVAPAAPPGTSPEEPVMGAADNMGTVVRQNSRAGNSTAAAAPDEWDDWWKEE